MGGLREAEDARPVECAVVFAAFERLRVAGGGDGKARRFFGVGKRDAFRGNGLFD